MHHTHITYVIFLGQESIGQDIGWEFGGCFVTERCVAVGTLETIETL